MTTTALKVVNWLRVTNFAMIKEDENIEELTQMKAMKLLYYAQGISLAAYDKPLFDDDILAWKYGPVVRSVHDKYYGQRSIVQYNQDLGMDEDSRNDYKELNSNEEFNIILNTVQEFYGDKSAIDLMNMTHKETPWMSTHQNDVIDTDLIRSYFKEHVLE